MVWELSAMSHGRVRRLVSDKAATITAFAANAANSVQYRKGQYRKVLLSGAFTVLAVVAAVPILISADMPSVGANNTLKCYDRAGDYQPCPARANASLSRSDGPTTASYRPASWAASALYLQESQATVAADQPAIAKTQATAVAEQPAVAKTQATAAAEQPPIAKTNAPAARRIIALRRRTAAAMCGRHLLPCVFSALRRGVTHLASVAATESGALRGRGFKERYRPNDL
jgi:hypothetical protein